jgi:peptidoglycan/LPS O-acetylase OafA/YrhL
LVDDVDARNETVAAVAAPFAETPSNGARSHAPVLPYQPGLDGIRAFAIIAVIGFHMGYNQHNLILGGYLGVDAFFVLSGFLITTLLLREYGRADRVSFRGFYARRALRLLPLLYVMVAIGVVVNLLQTPGTPGRPTREGLIAALFYYANWFHIDNAGLGFLASTWSLAIEEQFYLLWPLVLVGLLRTRIHRGALLGVTLAGAAASAIWRYHVVTHLPTTTNFVSYYLRYTGSRPRSLAVVEASVGDRVYFGSDTRADMLLVGCALAILIAWKGSALTDLGRRVVTVLGLIGFAIATWFIGWVHYESTSWMWRYGVVFFELSVAAVIATIMLNPKIPFSKFFGIPLLVWIGRRAYGLYLIHSCVFTLLRRDVMDLGGFWTPTVQLLITFVATAFAYRFIEAPALKLKDRFAPAGARPAPAPAAAPAAATN